MKYIALSVILALAVGLSTAASLHQVNNEWEAFKTTYGKTYSDVAEELHRMEIFLQNLERIAEHNIRYRNGEVTYTLGMNRFGDLTHPEFVARFNGYKSNGLAKKAGKTFMKPANFQAPASMDWRTEGYVTPVKDQGQCGSCWSFSSTGSLEGQHFRKTGQLVSLSEQNLVDCSTENLGCNGGDMQLAYDYIKANHGIDTEASYPYEARDRTCRFKAANVGATITGYEVLRSGDEAALVDALASVGPIAIAIDASHMSFQFYDSGVYVEKNCGNGDYDLDHAVLAVGYGSENGADYFLVKNSWGTSWGQKGYIKMARNRNNQCGVATECVYPTV